MGNPEKSFRKQGQKVYRGMQPAQKAAPQNNNARYKSGHWHQSRTVQAPRRLQNNKA
jgi:hypothetical protein